LSYIGQRPVVGRYTKLDQINTGFNGNTATFNLTAGSQAVIPGTEQNLLLSLGGVIQEPKTDFTLSGSQITFTTAPALNAVIKFTRASNQTARLVDYQDGSTLTEATLDQDGNQTFFMAQEAIDKVGDAIGLNASNVWDAQNKRITNVADPTSNQDAATKTYVDGILTTNNTAVANATTQANNAAASATAAANSQSSASASAATATSQATAAANSATAAANSASSVTVTTGLVIAMAIAL